MSKQSGWFGWWKRLFVQTQKTDKKAKKWRWFSIGRRRVKQIDEAKEKQRKYAVKVAIATAAAAKAAVAAAHAAAEIVRYTADSNPHSPFHNYSDKYLAAIQIQTAFRRYLARKALVALKGVVKLQALIRGQAVRRRLIMKMKNLSTDPFKINTHTEYTHLYPMERGELQTKIQCQSQRKWDYSMLSKEDMETLWSRKHEANLKSDRMMKYSFSHRERINNGMMMEDWVPKRPETARQRHSQRLKLQGLDYLKPPPTTTSAIPTPELFGSLQVRSNCTCKHDSIGRLYSPVSCPRRSLCGTHWTSSLEDHFIPNSLVFQTYMAATESAKARLRSISTPRQRIGTQNSSSKYKNHPSFYTSYNGDMFKGCGMNDGSQFSPYSYKLRSPFLS